MPKGPPTLGAESDPVYLDRRCVVNPGTGKRNIRYRVAASPGWKAAFTLVWDNTVVGVSKMEAVVRDSGTLVGIGSGRGIGLGRFKVTNFETVDGNAKKPRSQEKSGQERAKQCGGATRVGACVAPSC